MSSTHSPSNPIRCDPSHSVVGLQPSSPLNRTGVNCPVIEEQTEKKTDTFRTGIISDGFSTEKVKKSERLLEIERRDKRLRSIIKRANKMKEEYNEEKREEREEREKVFDRKYYGDKYYGDKYYEEL